MISSYIIIAVLIAIKAFLFAFIVCEKLTSVSKRTNEQEEKSEFSCLKKELICLTETEDEEEEQQISENEKHGKLRQNTTPRAVFQGNKSNGVNHSIEMNGSKCISTRGNVRFFSKHRKTLKYTSYKQRRNFNLSGKCTTRKSAPECSNTIYLNSKANQAASSSFANRQIFSDDKEISKIDALYQLDPRSYKSRRGVKIIQSWVKFNGKPQVGDINKRILKKIQKLEVCIAKRRNVLQKLFVVDELSCELEGKRI